ncbi:thioredoxin-like 3-2, chloroplastic isoform X2 [Actinidia eriantha]|uniref:thioredoxin-like 3-2, chloroplastic isoform X2 n=1 Tax=Actinidia eriantha TaxID=165200 RepID=UPI00258DC00B|nr:thioredoxin-like 3-2, chloroplastic isoform X2 [Actinidia eriantha]
MSYAIRLSLTFNPLSHTKPPCFSCDLFGFCQQFSNPILKTSSVLRNHGECLKKIDVISRQIKALTSHSEEGSVQGLDSSPVSVELERISSENQFDRVVAEAQQIEESVVIVWIRFYSVDVNNVPHKLVVRAGVTKMPTIQLWKDSKKQAEVIGGHKAYLVSNEVREMIENEFAL